MTAYYVTFGLAGYFLIMAELVERKRDRVIGALPKPALTRIFLFAAAAVLVMVAGLRWRVGTDYSAYAQNYAGYKTSFISDLMTLEEPGIKGLAVISSGVLDDSATFFLLASVVTIGLMLWVFAKYSPAVSFSFAIFVLAGLWHGSFNGIRQYVACAIILAGHRFIVSRRPAHFGLTVFLASLFHLSALAMFALYFVPRRRLGIPGFVGFAALSLGALYSSDAVLGLIEAVKGTELTTSYVTTSINPLRIAVAVTPVALYALALPADDAEGEWFYRNMAVVHAGIMVAASWSAYLGRFGIYSAAFIPLLLPRLLNFSSLQVTTALRMGAIALFGVYWYIAVSGSGDLDNFQWIFERIPA